MGFLKVDEIFSYTTPDRLLAYYTATYENLMNVILDACTEMKRKETGLEGEEHRVVQTCTILDMKDVSLSMASKVYCWQLRLIASSSLPRIWLRTTILRYSGSKDWLIQYVFNQYSFSVYGSVADCERVD